MTKLVQLEQAREIAFRRFTGKALDMGCGFGSSSIALAKSGQCAKILAVDYSLVEIEKGRGLAKQADVEGKVEFIHADGNTISFTKSEFDVIFFKSALHHLKTWHEVLSKTKEWLKPNGIIYIEEPLRTNPVANFGVMMYYSIGKSFLKMHEKPDENQWPFDPKELLAEVGKYYKIEDFSYHWFISNLFDKAGAYAKNPTAKRLFKGLAKATERLDSFVQSSPRLQRNCSMIIV